MTIECIWKHCTKNKKTHKWRVTLCKMNFLLFVFALCIGSTVSPSAKTSALFALLFYQRWRTKTKGFSRWFSGAEVSVFLKRPSSWIGGIYDHGVLFCLYNVIGPDRETPQICDQWESQRLKLAKIWTGVGKSNKQAVLISAGCQCEVPLVVSLQCHAVANIWCCRRVCVLVMCMCLPTLLFVLCQWAQLLKRLSFRNVILLAWKTVN